MGLQGNNNPGISVYHNKQNEVCMGRFIKLCLLAVCMMAVIDSQAQQYTSSNRNAIKLYEKAKAQLMGSQTAEALDLLLKAHEADPNFVEPLVILADLYAEQRNDSMMMVYAYKAVEINADYESRLWLFLGRAEMKANRLDKAQANFRQFLERDTRNTKLQEEATRALATLEFRQTAMLNPVPYNPQNMGPKVNSIHDEYLPAITADGQTLIFTRRFPRTAATTAATPMEEDFYISTFVDGEWTKAVRMPEPVNSHDNEGAQCLSQDGRIMVFTACDRRDGLGRCDLYISIRKGNKWTKPRNLWQPVNSGSWESQPSLSIDGKTLFFSSNRKGGQGGRDIWMSTMQSDGWSEPQNLGPVINTPGDECSPFIHYDNQTLYFASDYHPGMGGMDIFMSHRLPDGTWSTPQNIGYPINTPGNENSLVVSYNGTQAFFASDQLDGYGATDLYQFELPEKVRPQQVTYMKGRVYDSKTGNPLGANFAVVDIESGDEIVSTQADPANGTFIISLPAHHNYALSVSAKGYLFHSENIELTEGSPDQPFLVDIALNPIVVGESVALRNVFFNTAEYSLRDESHIELDKVVALLKNNPSIQVELSGHTDNVGSPESNMVLSSQRAKAVYDYLVDKGIDPQRLSYKGYGDTQPIAPNTTDEGRAANRRTVFTITEIK